MELNGIYHVDLIAQTAFLFGLTAN